MSEAREAAAQVPLHELLLDFAHAARTRGVKATDKGKHHVCTPVFEDGHGFAMHPISMFEEAAMRLKRDAEKASPVVTDAAKAAIAFVLEMMDGESRFGTWDGGDIQDLGVKTGVLIPTEVTEACGEGCNCAEYDDFPQTCYRLNPGLSVKGGE